ncbi:two-component system, response regulator YesN [Clostridium cavendishii DSM 21758]|uniref:Stage 0 sporulation protein A homolog n=1 Tax=Clostridium cavendishii DSM 21758 TaxID=1121302 RepID=A0A1M6G6C5_9CLOT|nr:response regulator [Clostridium cavendishii]SHJ05511.1 two-component system, response regulator YesN [Clostridium cavendishii DSM 21758]
MLKVLLVEDELIVRVGLKSVINWNDNGFELIGEASNGEQALEIIRSNRPDIVITDIKMPKMDGIELIRTIKKDYDDMKIIVLSCHDEFAIVKEVMKLGVEDYFLKLTMEPEELVNILLKLKDKIDTAYNSNIKILKDDIDINKNILREKFMRDIILTEEIKPSEIEEQLRKLEFKLNYKNMIALVLWIDKWYLYENYSDNDKYLFSYGIMNIVNEILNDFTEGYCVEVRPGEFLVIYTNKDKNQVENNYNQLANKIKTLFKSYLNVSASIGISNIKADLSYLKKAYIEALEAVGGRYFLGAGSIISFLDTYENREEEQEVKTFDLNTFTIYLEQGNIDGIRSYIENIISLLNNRSVLRLKPRSICMTIIIQFIEVLNNSNEEINNYLYENYEVEADMKRLETLEDMKLWLRWFCSSVENYIRDKSNNSSGRIISRVKKFINDNYNKDLNLEELAALVYISPSYLSNLFKVSTGKTITDYITEVRIDMAKEYIKNSNMKMYEVAETVGYNNIYYFSKIFKKHVGVSPLRYKDTV